MKNIKSDFIADENRDYQLRIGRTVASSLSGFIAGIIVTIIIVAALFDISLK
jgi:tetrahydromethanopterin S-methyltransferase subunit F